jgi:hypothetical protein
MITETRVMAAACRPTSAREEESCARQIRDQPGEARLPSPTTPQDVGMLMEFHVAGRNEGGSVDAGIERALRRLLADPEFVHRCEPEPVTLAAGRSDRIPDLALASRPGVPDEHEGSGGGTTGSSVEVVKWAKMAQMLDLGASGTVQSTARVCEISHNYQII